MKHTPLSAARAARSILERTSKIARTWPEYEASKRHSEQLAPRDRPGDHTWANAWQAYRLASEQMHGPQAQLAEEQSAAIQRAIQGVMPELFAEYWINLPHPTCKP